MRRIIIFYIWLPVMLSATKYAGEFQELGVGGRPCAMGGAGVAQYVDASVIYFNPAGSFYTEKSVMAMHAENFAGVVKNEFASVVIPGENRSVGIGVQYLSVSDIILTTLSDTTSPPGSGNPPVPYDTVGTRDVVLYFNGAKGNAELAYGMNIKIFYRDLSVIKGFGGGIDLGVVYNREYFSVGAAIRDFILAPIIWNNENKTKETIMPKFSLGIAPVLPMDKINSTLKFECDVVKPFDIDGFNINMGVEYGYKDFLFGRAGHYNGNYTFGAGIRYKKFSLDYALVLHSELNNSNKVSAGVTF